MAHQNIRLELNAYNRLKDFKQTFYVFHELEEVKVGDHVTFMFGANPALQRKISYIEEVEGKKVAALVVAMESKTVVPFTTKAGSFHQR